MKPAFALDFRDGSVALLHRTARGWTLVGQTAFGSPDMDEALGFLRLTALGLSPGGVATKLIIPNDQILYLTLHAPGPDAAKRRKQITAALEGRTPYPVADLVFDWWGKGDEVNVAVIARETLQEAEGFAQMHRFNPVSYVAVPDNGIFQGEPWFGATTVAPQILAPGEKVDRDQDPVRITGRDTAPAENPAAVAFEPEATASSPESSPEPVAEPVAEWVPDPQPLPEPAPLPEPEPAPELAAGPEPEPEPEWVAPPAPKAELTPEPAPEWQPNPVRFDDEQTDKAVAVPMDTGPVADPILGDLQAPADAVTALPENDALSYDLAEQPATVQGADDLPALPDAEGPGAEMQDTDEAPMALDVADDVPMAPLPPLAPLAAPERTPAEPARSVASGFSLLRAFTSRRKTPSAPPPLKAEPTVADRQSGPAPVAPPVTLDLRSDEAMAIASVTSTTVESPPDLPEPLASESAGMAVIGAAGANPRSPAPKLTAERPTLARPLPGSASKGAAAKGAKGLRGFGAFVTAPNIAGPKKPRAAAPAPAARAPVTANPSALSPARPGTRPIGLGAKPLPQRGKPRFLGLILTGILLVLLALVALWSTVLALNPDAPSDTAVAGLEQSQSGEAAELPAPEDEMLADLQDPADFTEAEIAAQAEADDLAVIEATAVNPASTAEAAPQTGLVSDTGAASVTPAGDAQDEIFLAAVDSPPDPPDPSALSAPLARADVLPSPAVPPPPFGTVYQFDADGRIVPTPEGIATPEGVLLIAGKPPVVPASRSAAVVTAVAASQPAAVVPGAEAPLLDAAGNPSTVPTDPLATDVAPVFADPALQGFRPKPRPATLQVPTQNGAAEDPALAPQTESRFASLRPQKRPASIAALAAPPVDETAIEAAVQTASLASGGEVLPQDRSPLALSVSRKPTERPKGLVQTASAAAAPAAQEAVASNAEPAQEADDEPEQDGPMPDLPTSASVAKQATVKNALDLSKIALIGVFGTDSRRYALVRQPNGRLIKVKVGDKLDGGKVAAITTNGLTIQKGGRTVTLELPSTTG